jgi:hypothetical protein
VDRMKNKMMIVLAIVSVLIIDFMAGSYYPIDKDLVAIQRTKQGLFLIMDGNLYTVSKLVTETDSFQEMKRIK